MNDCINKDKCVFADLDCDFCPHYYRLITEKPEKTEIIYEDKEDED